MQKRKKTCQENIYVIHTFL